MARTVATNHLFLFFFLFIFLFQKSSFPVSKRKTLQKTALLYIYEEGSYYRRNFGFFIRNGIRNQDGIDYYLLIKGSECGPCFLIRSFSNVKVFWQYSHEGLSPRDFDYLATQIPNWKIYHSFVLMDSSGRGPFLLPGFFELTNHHWLELILRRLSPHTPLIGATLECHDEITVHSYFRAITPTVFELGLNHSFGHDLTQRVLSNNWNVGSLEYKYKHVDFTRERPAECHESIQRKINPYETVFWKQTCLNHPQDCRVDSFLEIITTTALYHHGQ
jgi:hypothetical protein